MSHELCHKGSQYKVFLSQLALSPQHPGQKTRRSLTGLRDLYRCEKLRRPSPLRRLWSKVTASVMSAYNSSDLSHIDVLRIQWRIKDFAQGGTSGVYRAPPQPPAFFSDFSNCRRKPIIIYVTYITNRLASKAKRTRRSRVQEYVR